MSHHISSGSVLSNTIASSTVYVYEGGLVYNITVSGADIYVYGGSAFRTNLDQGRMTVRDGGKVDSTIVNGRQMYLSSGTVGNNTTLLSGGVLYVSPNAVASAVTIQGGGSDLDLSIFDTPETMLGQASLTTEDEYRQKQYAIELGIC